MTIIIHQEICGEQNKAWDLLRTTLPDNSIAKKIAFKTDLQDSPPSGISWKPVIRGFSFNEYYLLIKTYPDTSPDVRNGRVFSHCLIISMADLPLISDLRELFIIFKDKIDKTILLEPINLIVNNGSKIILKDTLQLRFNKAIQGFTNLLSNNGSIIWVGQEHYEIAVSKFWQLLSTVQKEIFNFGINFNPSEIPNGKINFIVVPENIENKFDGKGYCIVRKNDSIILTEVFEQFLAGEENATARLIAFTDAIEVEVKEYTVQEISTIAKGVSTFENLNKTKDLKLLNTLSNIVAKFSPDNTKGIAFKNKLIERIDELLELANETDILLLKNFQTKYFKDSEKKFSLSIKKWIDDYLLSEKENKKKDFTPTIIQIYDSISFNWLMDIFKKKIRDFLLSINQTSAVIIWRWITNEIKLLKIISSDIDSSTKAEAFFITSFSPSINKTVLKEVKAFAIEKGWLKLHATIVKSEYNFASAIIEQLKVDSDTNYYEAIEIITTDVKAKEIIDIAIAKGDRRLISLSGKLCKSNSSLLEIIEIENSNWQELLLSSVKNGNRISDGIKEPQKVIYKLYDALHNGKPVNESLLGEISLTDFANILDYPNRNTLWAKLPVRFKNKFLEKTSSALLEALSKNSTYQVPTDKELSDYIISYAISTFLYYNSNNIKAVMPIFNTYSQLPEYIIKDYVSNYSGKLDIVDSTQLGKLIYSRNYISTAYVINSKTHSNKNFKYALAECYSLLDFFTRGYITLSGTISDVLVTQDQWWSAFTELSIKLYNSGPTENKIWKQANGEEYDLILNVTGKESWITALHKLRNGGYSDITIKKLLKAMLKDYPKNDELKTLKDLLNKL